MALASRSALRTGCGLPVRQAPCVVSTRPLLLHKPAQHRWQGPCFATETQLDNTPSTTQPVAKPSEEFIPDSEFSITKISYGSILTPLGSFLLAYGFGAYFLLLPGADLSSLMLIYGFPITVLGFALSYAQLEPAPLKTTKAAFELRDRECTDIQKQIREDCTRYRYGDEQHLEEALDKIFRFNKSGGIARKAAPILTGLREEVVDGSYALILEFTSKLEAQKWEDRQSKFQSFFGPGIVARVAMTSVGADVALICDGSGAGRGGKEKKDVLPPLLPGLRARQQE